MTWWRLTSTAPSGEGFDVVLVEEGAGYASLHVRGNDVSMFSGEAGGHRWQRVPPTERRGRVHTSTVTVAVLPLRGKGSALNVRDVEITTTRGSGPGGQHRNTTDSCVLATHKPSKISVRIDGRSQHQNRRLALDVLAERVAQIADSERMAQENVVRRAQVGSGQRGDKIRTYRVRDNLMTDHRTGQKCRLDLWLRGEE